MHRKQWPAGFIALGLGSILMGAAPAAAQPTAPVRVIAEWEPAVGTLISWPLGIPQALVQELAADDMLFVLVRNPQHQNDAAATFASWGIDPAHVEYIACNVQTHWPRDWGPHQIFDGDGTWGIVDPIFEGYPWVDVECAPITSPGGYVGDNAVPIFVAGHFGAPLHTLPAYLTGGNFLVDGQQAAFSTCAMVGENRQLWSEAEFLALAQSWLGVSQYHVVNNTEDHGIQHIDCWLKVIDEETLLVKQPPVWHEEYDRIAANLAVLEAATTCWGRPYRILRVDCPPYDGYNIAAYTNALILNTKVLVPLFDIPGDAAALAEYASALPGYEVIGFPWGSWYYYDALHCRTRAIFDRHMLVMRHRRIDAELPAASAFPVTVFIDDRSEAGLIDEALRIVWRVAGEGAWQEAALTPGSTADWYEGAIPGQPAGTTVEYYVAAADLSGRSETLPRSAPAGFYAFDVVEAGLTIAVVDPPAVVPPWSVTPMVVDIDLGDDTLVADSAQLMCRWADGDFVAIPLDHVGGGTWVATLPRFLCDEAPEYYVRAEGTSSGEKTDPPAAPASVHTVQVGELAPQVVVQQTFASGLPPGWSADGLWHVTGACPVYPACEAAPWAYFGQDGTCNYATGSHVAGTLRSAAITLPALPPGGTLTLTYCSHLETEGEPGYDLVGLYINDDLRDVPASTDVWETRTLDVSAFAGQAVTLAWQFDSIDGYYNQYHGWQVDDVRITGLTALDCTLPPLVRPGDLNCDGAVSFADINAFVLALSNPTAYAAAYPGCPIENGDVNRDGPVGFRDINPFVRLLSR